MSYDERELLADYKRLMAENAELKSLCDELLLELDETRTAINKAKPSQNVKTPQMVVPSLDCVDEAVKIMKSELGDKK